MKRPMLYWVSLFILGEVLSRVLPISLVGVCVFGTIALYIAFCVWKKSLSYIKKNQNILGIGILFFLMGVLCMVSSQRMIERCMLQTGTEICFTGKITGIEDSERGTCYIMSVKKFKESNAKWQSPFHMKIMVFFDEKEPLMIGSWVWGKGKVKEFSNATNPGVYDEQSYQYGKGVFLTLQKAIVKEVLQPKVPVRQFLYEIRSRLSDVYYNILEEKHASLAAAMVLGDREGLDTDTKQLYQRNGIAHLMAISGLHIAMLGGTLYHVLKKILGGYMVSAGIGMAFICLYGLMTGMSGATMRAVVMLLISIGADVSGRRYDMITSIAFALFLMLLINPYQITQVGFLLSFGAIIGIAVVNPVWKHILSAIPCYMEGLFVSISVQLILLPIMLYYFYEIPLYGVLLNVIVVPLMNLLLAVLILGGMVGCFWLPAAKIAILPAKFIFALYEWLCHVSECAPFHTVCIGRPDIGWIVVYYVIMAVFLLIVYRFKESLMVNRYCGKNCRTIKVYRKHLLIGIGIVYVLQFAVFFLPTSLILCIFNVGQGDGIYVRTPFRHHILIDGGSSSVQKVGTYVLKNGIRFYGGRKLDYVFVSHSDRDHYSGIKELLEDNTVFINNFVLPDIANPDEAYLELEQRAEAKGCRLYYMKKGDVLYIDGITFSCLNPEMMEYADKNAGSLVLKLSYRNFDALLTGDMDKSVEESILMDMEERESKERMVDEKVSGELEETIEILKVAHHGSATSSSEAFLKAIHPEVACVSVGEKNRYGHPAAEVMERLSVYVKKTYLTKDSGAITIDTDGKTYRVVPFLTN